MTEILAGTSILRLSAFPCLDVRLWQTRPSFLGRHRRRATAPSHLIVGPLQAGKLAFLDDGGALPAEVGLGSPSWGTLARHTEKLRAKDPRRAALGIPRNKRTRRRRRVRIRGPLTSAPRR